jgi:integrase
MAIYKRGKYYWFDFIFKGQRVQRSTHQADRRAARQIEAACRTALAKGEIGIVERKRSPSLKVFAQRFIDEIGVQCATKPRTISFYAEKLNRLLEFEPMARAPLEIIDEALISAYVQQRLLRVSLTSVNRELATLRRLLRLAHEWKLITSVPRIRLLPGERSREFVLGRRQEQLYLAAATQPLRDITLLMLDTGLRVGEGAALLWSDIRLEPAGEARYGFLRVRDGKSGNARRNVPLSDRVREMLVARATARCSAFVFPGEFPNKPILVTSLDHQHSKLRKLLKLPTEFVLHGLRHTMLTRLGESGVDAFTIMRIAGHSSVTVSQRYIHPSPEAVENAITRLEALNGAAEERLQNSQKRLSPPTDSTTLRNEVHVNH